MQQNLFSDLPKDEKPAISLTIPNIKADKRKQTQINNKIKKIEKLKKLHEDTVKVIRKIQLQYDQIIAGNEKKLENQRTAFIQKLYERWGQKGFARWQKFMMQEIIQNHALYVRGDSENARIVSEISEEMLANSMEEMNPNEKEAMEEMKNEFFNFMGIDMTDQDMNEAGREHFYQQYARQQEKQREEYREMEKREKRMNTDKDFQKLYKNLVKLAHPDLVTDPTEKGHRELLMKQLSRAWQERDYHQLLLLKSSIELDDEQAVPLGDEQVKILLNQLNNEISDWEVKIYDLKTGRPDTSFYYQNFHARSDKAITKKIESYEAEITQLITTLEEDLQHLKTKKSTKEFLTDTEESMAIQDNYWNDGW